MWVPVLLVALYTGWVLWQRHRTEALPPGRPMPSEPLAKYGNQLKIFQFYASTGRIAPGGKALLCYSVLNAKALRLDPPVEKVWPSMSRCFDVAPSSNTHYTLTAEGVDHQVVSASLDIAVER